VQLHDVATLRISTAWSVRFVTENDSAASSSPDVASYLFSSASHSNLPAPYADADAQQPAITTMIGAIHRRANSSHPER
jgi:hypothetical protein